VGNFRASSPQHLPSLEHVLSFLSASVLVELMQTSPPLTSSSLHLKWIFLSLPPCYALFHVLTPRGSATLFCLGHAVRLTYFFSFPLRIAGSLTAVATWCFPPLAPREPLSPSRPQEHPSPVLLELEVDPVRDPFFLSPSHFLLLL